MRFHYLSDLHLERQAFDERLPSADVLLIAGDLCHARCLEPNSADKYASDQRGRVMRFIDQALKQFRHVVLVPGNHEHYDGVFEETVSKLQRNLPGVTVLQDNAVDIGGISVFGSTLWTDFDGRSAAAMNGVRRRVGEFFFVKTANSGSDGRPVKFQPEHALAAHDCAIAALHAELAKARDRPVVVVTHHAPSALGCNPRFRGNGLDAAYASDLDALIARLENVPFWIHGHTHYCTNYRIGRTMVSANALGFRSNGRGAAGFSVGAHFDLD